MPAWTVLACNENHQSDRREYQIDSTPSGLYVGITGDGEVYSTSAVTEPWRKAGQVDGAPTALTVAEDAWYVATEEAILSSGTTERPGR